LIIDLIIQNVCERTDGNGVVMVLELASQSKKQCAIESAQILISTQVLDPSMTLKLLALLEYQVNVMIWLKTF